ncbi:MAG: TetR family transcriptional regulator [Hyphomicrobiales bacterium]|nr:MAG: TetR family transcriptional regulator [Hyphomicrobiales bacterium]
MARTVGSVGTKTFDEVRKAALYLFARHGYASVSMRQIAARVGVQAGAIYNHFPNKQALLSDLLTQHMRELIEACEARPTSKLPLNALEQFVRFHIRYHIDRADEVFIAYMELRNLEPENFREVQVLRQRYERVLRDILRDGAKAGAFEISDAPVAGMAIIAMLTGVNTWFRYGGRLSVSQIEEIYVKMVMQSVGVFEPTALLGALMEENA